MEVNGSKGGLSIEMLQQGVDFRGNMYANWKIIGKDIGKQTC
jgi:hypothetical protein